MLKYKMTRQTVITLVVFSSLILLAQGTRVRNIYWNTTTASKLGEPLTVVVNKGNQAWEYDQVNIICPVYKAGGDAKGQEEHIIYSVEKEEFEQCRVTSPRPRIVAICNRPKTFMYFTLTFRSFTPTPGGLEFRPGQDYYFVSTASNLDIHRRVGGYCATHNMRMVFRVAGREEETKKKFSTPRPNPTNFWAKWWNVKRSRKEEDPISNYVNIDSLSDTLYSRHPKAFHGQASPLQSSGTTLSSSLAVLSLLYFLVSLVR